MSVLVIAEKPSVAKDIASVIGATTRNKNGYHEGNGYIVSNCLGHLVELANREAYDSTKSWKDVSLPVIPEKFILTVKDKTSAQFYLLKKLMNLSEVTEIICATDAGREGQLIFEWAYVLADCKKPVKRLWVSDNTDAGINKALANIKDNKQYQSLFHAAQARSQADWTVGINMTMAMSVLNNTTLSVGRVQTPTLAFTVNRQHEIDKFVPSDYFTISADFKSARYPDEIVTMMRVDEENKTHIDTKEQAEAIAMRVRGKNGVVTALETSPKTQDRPRLYSLSTLQADANVTFKYTLQQTLDIVQSLYEKHKIVTYPRTDSEYLTTELSKLIPDRISKLSVVSKGICDIVKTLQKQGVNLDSRVVNDSKVSDHHAIIVTDSIGSYDLTKLSTMELNVLMLIISRMLSALHSIHKYNETVMTVTVENERFTTKGKAITLIGWKEVPVKVLCKKPDNGTTILNLSQGENVTTNDVRIKADKTKPPLRYTDKTILEAMKNASRHLSPDDNDVKEYLSGGIGTEATRASILERLVSSEYLKRDDVYLVPSAHAIELIGALPEQLVSPVMTANWEEKLEAIVKNKLEAKEFIDGIKAFTGDLISELKNNSSKYTFKARPTKQGSDHKPIGICPMCGNPVVENQKAYGCLGYNEPVACRFAIWKQSALLESQGKKMTNAIAKELIKNGKSHIKGLTSKKTGNTYDAFLVLTIGQDGKPQYTFKF